MNSMKNLRFSLNPISKFKLCFSAENEIEFMLIENQVFSKSLKLGERTRVKIME